MKYGLTRKQTELLEFIRNYREQYGYSPTFAEMAEGIKAASKSTIDQLMNGLKQRGYIDYLYRRSRSVVLVEQDEERVDQEITKFQARTAERLG